jgi:hypothetical protein
MTNLSPAAQAVRLAAIYAGPELEGRLAVALRAAANQLSYLLPFEDSAHIDVADLLALADELEAQS